MTGQPPKDGHIRQAKSGPDMSALANHAFAKMNGIGNEIVVVDMRDSAAPVTPDDARAVASAKGVPYDPVSYTHLTLPTILRV